MVSDDNLIIPGTRVGYYFLSMSKDEVINKLGKPRSIFYRDEQYTLQTLPEQYYLVFAGISFSFRDDKVQEITASDPRYKLANGVGVGSKEKQVKKALGDNFHLQESKFKDYLNYQEEGLQFEIHKSKRTVLEINVAPL